MRSPYTNPQDDPLSPYIQALRQEPAPEAPETVIRLAAKRPQRPPLVLRAGLVAAAVVVLGLLFVLAPKDSVAASLDTVVRALQEAPAFRARTYEVLDGQRRLIREAHVRGEHWRLVDFDEPHEIAYDGENLHIWMKGDTHVTVQKAQPGISELAGNADAASMLRSETVKNLRVERGLSLDGTTVDRYTLTHEFVDGADQFQRFDTVLYVDPRTNRPLRDELPANALRNGEGGYFPASVTVWEYEPRDLQIEIAAKGVPTYNLSEQRERFAAQIAAPQATTTVAGKTVSLHAVIVDSNGYMEAVVSGSDARPGESTEGLRVKGQRMSDRQPGRVSDGGGYLGREYVYQAIAYKRVKLLGESARLENPLEPGASISVPIWESRAASLHLLGYASFEVKHVIRTTSLIQLLAPENRCILIEGPASKGAPTVAKP